MKFTKETWRRVWRTFIQAFLASIIGTVSLVDTTDHDTLIKSLIFVVVVPALAAGIAAIMNLEQELNE
ncbi:MAG: hypothetical protein MJZ20_08380 [Bacteroidaceae bacterium]|nr:hypothetical protein [Bacteroidaceae bacterium]